MNESHPRQHYRKISIVKRKLKNCRNRKNTFKDKLKLKEQKPKIYSTEVLKKIDLKTIYAALNTGWIHEQIAWLSMIYHLRLYSCRVDGKCQRILTNQIILMKNISLNTTENSTQKILKRFKRLCRKNQSFRRFISREDSLEVHLLASFLDYSVALNKLTKVDKQLMRKVLGNLKLSSQSHKRKKMSKGSKRRIKSCKDLSNLFRSKMS